MAKGPLASIIILCCCCGAHFFFFFFFVVVINYVLFVNTMVVIHRLLAVCLQCYTGNGGSYATRQGVQRFVQAGRSSRFKGHFQIKLLINPPSWCTDFSWRLQLRCQRRSSCIPPPTGESGNWAFKLQINKIEVKKCK